MFQYHIDYGIGDIAEIFPFNRSEKALCVVLQIDKHLLFDQVSMVKVMPLETSKSRWLLSDRLRRFKDE